MDKLRWCAEFAFVYVAYLTALLHRCSCACLALTAPQSPFGKELVDTFGTSASELATVRAALQDATSENEELKMKAEVAEHLRERLASITKQFVQMQEVICEQARSLDTIVLPAVPAEAHLQTEMGMRKRAHVMSIHS
jgi:hypothetical protein